MFKGKNETAPSDGVLKSIFLAYFILALHILVVFALGLLVIFFRGLVHYMPWLFLGGTILAGVSAYRVYLHMKQSQKTLRDVLQDPLLAGRSVEVSFLGGLASFRLGNSGSAPLLDATQERPALEDPDSQRIRELTELARLLESHLITREEFLRAKKRLFRS